MVDSVLPPGFMLVDLNRIDACAGAPGDVRMRVGAAPAPLRKTNLGAEWASRYAMIGRLAAIAEANPETRDKTLRLQQVLSSGGAGEGRR